MASGRNRDPDRLRHGIRSLQAAGFSGFRQDASIVNTRPTHKWLAAAVTTVLLLIPVSWALAEELFDVVILNGRVMDPETGLDAVRSVGIRGGTVAVIAEGPLEGTTEIDATGLVVAPGFVDLHAHGQCARSNEFQAMDGVTTALELELGVPDIKRFLAARQGNAIIHFGATISHGVLRTWAMPEHEQTVDGVVAEFGTTGDDCRDVFRAFGGGVNPGGESALEPTRYSALEERIDQGLRNGALGIGMPHQLYPGVTYDEIFRVFQLAGSRQAPIYTHVRSSGVSGIQEVLANAAATGAPLHILHINSSSLWNYQTNVDMVLGARDRGVDVTAEVYPYTAASTGIGTAMFADGWQERMGISYEDIQWQDTGERLTAESFDQYRAKGGLVIIHLMKPEWIRAQIANPRIIVASDGMPYAPGAHPRSAGTFSRFLGRYVRDEGVLPLMSALEKITLQPAERVATFSPQMKRKGRVQRGSDADLTVFDPDTIIDTADFDGELSYSKGVEHVLVNGTFVVRDGALVEGARPGLAIVSGDPSH